MVKHSYGWKPQRPDARDLLHRPTLPDAMIDLPTVQDLRPYCPPVWDQGPLGSCTAHAACGAFLYELMRQEASPAFEPSRLFEYYNARLLFGDADTDAGATIRDANKALAQYGLCSEDLWPYDPAQVVQQPPNDAYTAAFSERVIQYASVPQDLLSMKQTLFYSMLPIQIGFTVFDSFESPEVAQTGVVPMPDLSSERAIGGHAVLIVGYADTYVTMDWQVLTNVFLVRNSWSANWGEDGHFLMPYEYFTDPNYASDLWVIQRVPV